MCRAFEEMLNQVRAEAAAECAKSIARRMLATGKFSLEEIATVTDLSLDEVRKIQSESCAQA